MRRFLLSAAAVAALGMVSLQSASAADIPAPVYKAAPIAVWSWTGIYVGAVGTYGWADAQHCDFSGAAIPCDPAFPQTNMKGWMGGVTLGANYQVNNIVFGVEGDWSGGRLSGSAPSSGAFNCAGTCDNKITSVATLRGRLGYAWNRVMAYATLGGAWERLEGSIGTPVLASGSTTRSNFVWGVGAEAAITDNLSGKIEYLRTSKLGTFAYDTVGACGTPGCAVDVKELNMVRFGLNWRFNGLMR